MIRICRLLELRLMTLVAIVVYKLVVPVHMAGLTLGCYMRARQWEMRSIVVERRPIPVDRRMTL